MRWFVFYVVAVIVFAALILAALKPGIFSYPR